eukprot:403349230
MKLSTGKTLEKNCLNVSKALTCMANPFNLPLKEKSNILKQFQTNDRKFKTKFGAFMTTIIFLTIISYVIVKLETLFNKKDNKTARFVINEAQLDDPRISDVFCDSQDQEKIIKFNNWFNRDLELIKCQDKYFQYSRKDDSVYKDIFDFFCIKDKSTLRLGGTWTANRFEYLEVLLIPCRNTTTNNVVCATQQQQVDYFNEVDFQFRFVNQYFDFDDFDNPIKQYIDDRYYIPIEPAIQKSIELFIKRSKTKQNDNYIPFSPQVDQEFASVENIQPFTAKSDYGGRECFARVALGIDLQYDIYSRQVYTFADLLSDMGGIYSSLFAFGALIVGLFSENLFYYQIIKDLYQVRPRKDWQNKNNSKNGERPKNSKPLENLTSQKSLIQATVKNSSIKSQQLCQENNSIANDSSTKIEFENETKLTSRFNEKSDNQQSSTIEKIFNEIAGRINFKLSIKEILRLSFKCFRKQSKLKEQKDQDNNRNIYLFHKGVKKIDHEIDAISLMKLMKQVKLLTLILLNPTQKMMLGFQKKNVLDSDSSDEGDKNYQEEVRLMQKVKSLNPMAKLITLAKIKKQIKEYLNGNQKFKPVDERLVGGILNKNYKDSKEIQQLQGLQFDMKKDLFKNLTPEKKAKQSLKNNVPPAKRRVLKMNASKILINQSVQNIMNLSRTRFDELEIKDHFLNADEDKDSCMNEFNYAQVNSKAFVRDSIQSLEDQFNGR